MRTRRVVTFLACLLLIGTSAEAATQLQSDNALHKFTRGGVNVITGWVEVPKQIRETSRLQGAGSGWTWGVLRGLGHGFVRTAADFYEIVTFPFPAPTNYAPVIQPEFVFDSDV